MSYKPSSLMKSIRWWKQSRPYLIYRKPSLPRNFSITCGCILVLDQKL